MTEFQLPSTPSEPTYDLSYIIYDDPMTINLSAEVYTEVPSCLYTTTSVYTWTGLDATFMTIDATNNAIVTMQSNDKTKADGSPFTVTFQRTITVTSAGQTTASGATEFLAGAADLLTFTVTVVDPCVGGTINDPTLTAMTVQNGGTATEDFLDATDTVDDTYTIDGLCGDRDYAVYETDSSGSPLTWITVEKDTTAIGTHTITANPDDVSLVTGVQHQLELRITYVDYPSHAGKWVTLPITVNAADCDCELLLWDEPSRVDQTINVGITVGEAVSVPVATPNDASRSASQEINRCYIGSACVETSTYALTLADGSALPLSGNGGFITLNGDSSAMTVYPTKPEDIGTWSIWMTQDTASGANPYYEALEITVGCTITDIASPTAPDEGSGWTLTYNVYDPDLSIDLSVIDYPQTPLCGKSGTEVFVWTIPADAPITVDPDNEQAINVYTTDVTKHGVYTVRLTNTITHEDGFQSPYMEFDVTVLDPCRTEAINSVDVTAGIELKLGETATLDFLEATDATSVSTGVYQLCGSFSYVIVDPNDSDAVIDWISIAAHASTAGTYTITASPILEQYRDSSPNTYELWTTLDDYYPTYH